jgi:hypothetical protein
MPFPTTVKLAPPKLVIVVASLIRDIGASVAISTKFPSLLQVDDAVGILAGIKSGLSPLRSSGPVTARVRHGVGRNKWMTTAQRRMYVEKKNNLTGHVDVDGSWGEGVGFLVDRGPKRDLLTATQEQLTARHQRTRAVADRDGKTFKSSPAMTRYRLTTRLDSIFQAS